MYNIIYKPYINIHINWLLFCRRFGGWCHSGLFTQALCLKIEKYKQYIDLNKHSWKSVQQYIHISKQSFLNMQSRALG